MKVSSVNILGKKVKVQYGPDKEDPRNQGSFKPGEWVILVNDDDEADQTLLHEMVHALFRRLGLSGYDELPAMIEETLSESVANMITENFSLKPIGRKQSPGEGGRGKGKKRK